MTYFQVAGLFFSFNDKLTSLSERINYLPFKMDNFFSDSNFLFDLDIDCNLKPINLDEKIKYTNEIGSYSVTYTDRTYEWILRRRNSKEILLMNLNINTKKAFLNFKITDAFTLQAADDFTRFAFIYTAAFHQTVLLHASCIKFNKKGIAFMGKSGVGKSTHSSLWLDYIKGSELINDDQPAVKVQNGIITIYGTPWSGKTNCYKNIHTRLSAILLMEQKPYNKLINMSKIAFFTHLISACSLIKADKLTLKPILDTLVFISEQINGGLLENKADKEAVSIAYKYFQQSK